MDVVKTIKRIINNLFPEISAGYHLPIFAEVVGVRETPKEGDLCDEFRPRYAVDVQILNEYGEPDKKWPVLKDVILSVPVAGHEMGHFAYPENGTWVEIAFAYGSPNRPFIRSVLPHRLTMPGLERGEQKWQHSAASYQRIDKDGNHERVTDLEIHDKSLTRVIEALDIIEKFHQSTKNTKANDTEIIGAIKRIEAFGSVVVQSGGVMDLSAVDHVRITTKANAIIKALASIKTDAADNIEHKAGSNITSNAGANIESTAGGDISNTATNINNTASGDITETATGTMAISGQTAQVTGKTSASVMAPSVWVGTPALNLVALAGETAQLVADLAEIVAAHTHPFSNNTVGPVSQGGAITAVKTKVDVVKANVDKVAGA
jgi:hypothetical protein